MDVKLQTSNFDKIKISSVDTTAASSIILSDNEFYDECIGFLKLTGANARVFPESYCSIKKILGLSEMELIRAIPAETVKNHFQSITETLQNVLCCKENEEYLVSYLEMKRFLRKLSAPIVDKLILRDIITKTAHAPTGQRMLELMPGPDGKAKKTEYGMLGSRTGRLVVTSGPQILTLPSKSRKAFKSSFSSGKILQIDLISAEPKIALHMQGKDSITDVYDHISKVILEGKVTRDQAKLITLCSLYGQSPENLKKSLPDSISPRVIIRETKQFFDVYNLESILKNSQRNSNLRNVLGRPIFLPENDQRLLISYFLQSSAAEISILAFSEWCKHNKEGAIPLYIIHDALIVDCDKKTSDTLTKNRILTLKVGDWKFEAKVTGFDI